MESKSEPFTHADEIDGSKLRLFRVHWGPHNTIVGKVQTFTLHSNRRPTFMAASYFCGTKLSDKPIYLKQPNDEGPTTHLTVFETLYPLLELLCDHQGFEPELWWWVDSVCINKNNAQEKETQVKAMKDIYAAAKRTIIWLGNRSFDSDLAIDFVHELDSKRDLLESNREEIAALQSPAVDFKWRAVENLLSRDWWKRVWTVQELIISSRATFYCGTKNFRKSRFTSAILSMALCHTHDMFLLRDNIWDPAWNRRRMLQYYRENEPMHLVGTMAFLSDNEVTMPQDRIYALIGMVAQSDQQWVGEPDYKSHVADVYLNFVKNHVEACKSLDIICFSHIFNGAAVVKEPQFRPVPSWVPDWRARVRPRAVPLMVSQSQSKHIGNYRPLGRPDGEALYQAAGLSKPQYTITAGGELSCDGVLLDIIDGIGALTDENGRCSYSEQLIEPTSPINRLKPPELGKTPAIDFPEVPKLLRLIATCLVLDRRDKQLLQHAPRSFGSDFVAFCLAASRFPLTVQTEFLSWFQWNQNLMIHGHSLREIFSSIELSPSVDSPDFKATLEILRSRVLRHEDPTSALVIDHPKLRRERIAFDNQGFLPRFHDTTLKMRRRLMVTTQGHVGMAPARAAKDDVVAILYGCSVPVVLRPREGQTGFEFIGECYVHGYMDGEVLAEMTAGTRSNETFLLR